MSAEQDDDWDALGGASDGATEAAPVSAPPMFPTDGTLSAPHVIWPSGMRAACAPSARIPRPPNGQGRHVSVPHVSVPISGGVWYAFV